MCNINYPKFSCRICVKNVSYKDKAVQCDLFGFILNVTNLNYLDYKLLENISKEQKSIFLLGDFNVNLLNYNEHNQTNEYLDSLASKSFIPLILQPTSITSHSNTLIDNIFSDVIDPDMISGNLTATISIICLNLQ